MPGRNKAARLPCRALYGEEAFGRNLVELRERCGWKACDLARVLGISQAMLSQYESGRRDGLREALALLVKPTEDDDDQG